MILYSREVSKVKFLPANHLLAGRAQLSKEEKPLQQFQWLSTYYAHLITNLLVPETVIPISVSLNPKPSDLLVYFSKLRTVPGDHAIFSTHLQAIDGRKHSNCNCEACHHHRELHDSRIDALAVAKAKILLDFGIRLPVDDQSDFCQEQNKNIIFFEVEHLDTGKLLERLKAEGTGMQKTEIIQELVRRYDQTVLSTGFEPVTSRL